MPKSNGNIAMNPPEVGRPSQILGRQIPTLQFTLQNILMSLAAVIAASASLMLTVMVVLPLAACRSLLPMDMFKRPVPEGRGKVVLIVGASRGIGFNVLKMYADEEGTVVIAASRSIDSLRKAVIELGDTRAIIQCAEVDLTASKKQLSESIRALDKQYGPITHLYEVSGISNHLKDNSQWGLSATEEMINVNVSGTVTSVLTMYELMKERNYGTICIVGSVAGLYGPANMISYAATKSFVNTFASSLRILAAPCGVEVITVQPGFIDTRMTRQMRGQGSTAPGMEFESAYGMAYHMKSAVEHGGVSLVSWPVRQSVVMYALKAVNPICDELGRWASMKMGVAGKKIT